MFDKELVYSLMVQDNLEPLLTAVEEAIKEVK